LGKIRFTWADLQLKRNRCGTGGWFQLPAVVFGFVVEELVFGVASVFVIFILSAVSRKGEVQESQKLALESRPAR